MKDLTDEELAEIKKTLISIEIGGENVIYNKLGTDPALKEEIQEEIDRVHKEQNRKNKKS